MACRYLVLVAAVGCASASADPGTGTPYACDGISIPMPVRDTPVARSIASWRALSILPAYGERWLASVDAAARATTVPRDVGDRVRLQHEMLRVAKLVQEMRTGPDAPTGAAAVHGAVMDKVRAVAATPDELGALGASSRPRVASILGRELTERATKTCTSGSLKHVVKAGGLLAFRPLRAGATRALVSQLVAFDTNGDPHITPLVAEIELRLGDESTSPACVVQAGDDGMLRPRPYDEIEWHAPFVTVASQGVGCATCHHGSNDMSARDLTSGEEIGAIDDLRDTQVMRLARGWWASVSR